MENLSNIENDFTRRNGSREMVKFGNINTNVNHEVVPPFRKI